MRTSLIILPLLALLLCFPPPRSGAEEGTVEDNQVKAAYIFNFIKFVDWPSENAGKNVVIGVFGDSPVTSALDAIAGKQVKGHRVSVLHAKQPDEVKECNLIFVSQSEKGRLDRILAAAANRPILTISDSKRFLAAGGMIYLYTAN